MALNTFWRQKGTTLFQAQDVLPLTQPHPDLWYPELQNTSYEQDPGLETGLVIHYTESSDFAILLPQQQLPFPMIYGSIPI